MSRRMKKARLAVLILQLIAISGSLGGTQVIQSNGQIATLLGQMQSAGSEDRLRAFYSLCPFESGVPVLKSLFTSHPERADEIKLALINLLIKENSVVQPSAQIPRTDRALSEEYVNYYGDLIAAVSSLNDKRALDALLGAMETGNMATSALAKLGCLALDPVIDKLRSESLNTRHAATKVISQMLDPANLQEVSDPASRARIKNALVKAVKDEDRFVRMAAVKGLAKLRDPDVIPLLEKIAREDPYKSENGLYPVREAAKKALRLQ